MSDDKRPTVKIPFLKGRVPVDVEVDKHPAIRSLAGWGPDLRRKIEEACFADYREKVASIGPESLPKIRRAAEVWKHLEVRDVRIDPTVDDAVVVYVVPAWDQSEHMEWCVRSGELVYVGQFLGYPVDGYEGAGD